MLLHPQRHQQVHTGDGCRARARDHHAHVRKILLHHPQAVQNGGGTDDRRSVLIVVEHWNVHAFTQFLLDIETFRRFDVLEVDAAKRRLQRGHHVNEFVRVKLIHFNIKHVDTGKFLEQHALAFHHRFTGQRPDIAQSQHCGAVGDHRHQVATGRVFVGRQRIFFDLKARRGNARRVG